MTEVVTGEAVVLDVPCARFPSRLLALLIDMTLQVALVVRRPAGHRRGRGPPECRVAGRGAGRDAGRDHHRLPGRVRDPDQGPDAGEDGAGPARGQRRRRAGAVPPGAGAGARCRGGDLGLHRRSRADLLAAVGQGQAARRRVRRDVRDPGAAAAQAGRARGAGRGAAAAGRVGADAGAVPAAGPDRGTGQQLPAPLLRAHARGQGRTGPADRRGGGRAGHPAPAARHSAGRVPVGACSPCGDSGRRTGWRPSRRGPRRARRPGPGRVPAPAAQPAAAAAQPPAWSPAQPRAARSLPARNGPCPATSRPA